MADLTPIEKCKFGEVAKESRFDTDTDLIRRTAPVPPSDISDDFLYEMWNLLPEEPRKLIMLTLWSDLPKETRVHALRQAVKLATKVRDDETAAIPAASTETMAGHPPIPIRANGSTSLSSH